MEIPFRRSTSGSYNPLADGTSSDMDTWVCTAEHGVSFYATDELDGQPVKEVHVGAHIQAIIDGNCLHEKSTDLYAPLCDKDGNRNFKNQRLMAMEKMNREEAEHAIGRQSSKTSEDRRFAPALRQSFRWVDDDGTAQRLEGTCDAIQDLAHRPEIWLCIADHDVAYRVAPANDVETTGKYCKVGEKINAIKEDDWLRVLQVTTHWDPTLVIGLRSLHNIKRVTVDDTGMYLPLNANGHSLFKSHKLHLFEESAKMDNPTGTAVSKDEGGGCAVM